MNSAGRVNGWVTHERLDDEVIAINLESGAYFAFDGVAADCWSLLAAGFDTEHVAKAVAERYAVDPARTTTDVTQFVAQLEDARLITPPGPDADASAPDGDPLPAPVGPLVYAAPAVDRFDDLEELLLLDPIHEVDEAGWPVAAAE
jgi:hypothetical protein